MHLLISCAGSWLVLIGAFGTAWIVLPAPRSAADTVVIVVIGAAVLAFSRLGLGAVLALAVRLLPAGNLRSAAITAMLRIMPTMLRSTALAAASATLALHAAHGAPVHEGPPPADHSAAGVPAAVDDSAPTSAADPGWPSSPIDEPLPNDPGWPTEAPVPGDSPTATPPSDESPKPPADGDHDPGGSKSSGARSPVVHVVRDGDNLWSIAHEHRAGRQGTDDLVAEIYADNRDLIGPNPNLIMPGQRLEITP